MKKSILVQTLMASLLVATQGCAEKNDEAKGVAPLQRYCDRRLGDDNAKWFGNVDAVIVAKVLEIKPIMNQRGLPSNDCWAHLDIKESLKGAANSPLWAKISYGAHGKSAKDMRNPLTCPMKKGESYIVFGYMHSGTGEFNGPFLHAGKSDSRWKHCTPILPLESSQNVLNTLRTMEK